MKEHFEMIVSTVLSFAFAIWHFSFGSLTFLKIMSFLLVINSIFLFVHLLSLLGGNGSRQASESNPKEAGQNQQA